MAAYGRFMTHVTCRLTAKNRDPLRNPTLGQSCPWVPFCVTRSNPTHQLNDPIQPSPLQVEKFGLNPTRPNTTNNLTAWCNQILSNRALDALT